MKLSILILSITQRANLLDRLLIQLNNQVSENDLHNVVEILTCIDSGEQSIGSKRNYLKNKASGEYICFIDDDDLVSNDYLICILNELDKNYDIVGFFVEHIKNGVKQDTLICPNPSIDGFTIKNIRFWINMLHLCPHKRELANQINFPDINNWEDLEYSNELKKCINSQFRIEKILYYYYQNK